MVFNTHLSFVAIMVKYCDLGLVFHEIDIDVPLTLTEYSFAFVIPVS